MNFTVKTLGKSIDLTFTVAGLVSYSRILIETDLFLCTNVTDVLCLNDGR